MALALALAAVAVVFPAAPGSPSSPAGNASGALDASFDPSTTRNVEPVGLLVDGAGGIVVVGRSVATDDIFDRRVGLARHVLPHGEWDPAFGVEGRVETSTTIENDGGIELATALLDGAGRIVVVGSLHQDFLVGRFLADGSADGSFGTGGWVEVDVGASERANGAVVVGTDLVVVGESWVGDDTDIALARLDEDGEPVAAFSGDGRVTFGGAGSQRGLAVAALDGDLYVAGEDDDHFHLARLDAAGNLVPAFDGDGRLTLDFGGGAYRDDAGLAILAVDGELVASGRARLSYAGEVQENAAFVRVTPTGALVDTFDGPDGDGDGMFTVNAASSVDLDVDDEASSLLLDGTALVAGGSSRFWGASSGFLLKLDATTGAPAADFHGPYDQPGVVASPFLRPVRGLGATATGYAVAHRELFTAYRVSHFDRVTGAIDRAFGQPDRPVGVTAGPGDRRVTVSWSPLADTGALPLTAYEVVASPGGATATVGPDATTASVTGLDNGTAYSFTVRARNVLGAGPDSAPASGTPVAPPTTTTTASPAPPAPRARPPLPPRPPLRPRRPRGRAGG
ncbi:MAG: fibronectin type III domain-containing protein [Acidimicrobiia bacterium]|nr:fibronectin type III domain-containing protein [Acidimicrobiia bacterium]